MTNFEYLKPRFTGMSAPSEIIESWFAKRCAVKPFTDGIVDWLTRDADLALEFPVGTLIQWDEVERGTRDRRKGIYGIVTKLLEQRDGVLENIMIRTVDECQKTFDKTCFLRCNENNVRKADVPADIISIARSAVVDNINTYGTDSFALKP